MIAGIPILVREPAGYLRSELELLAQTSRDAERRRDSLDKVGTDAGLPGVSLDRHRDLLNAEIAQAETFLALLEPTVAGMGADSSEALGARPSGWTTEALLPYLLRDWTSTAELEAVSDRIGAALKHLFPDPANTSVVFAACGAGGLLAEIPADFDRVLGYDLTLPVLGAARCLLDGNSLEIALPRAIKEAGRITLRKRDPRSPSARVDLVAMDALDTAFADGSVDCVITSFLIDLIPDPAKLADEISRILGRDGILINYGPSGPLKAFWRFDQPETAAFLEAAGFTVVSAEAYRATYLDLSRDCPSWSFQNHVCYLTCARKAVPAAERPSLASPLPTELPEIIPIHFPGAKLIRRQGLGSQPTHTTIFRHEGIPGRVNTVRIGADAARIMALVDGQRTVSAIAELLARETPALPVDVVCRAFERYFQQRLLSWRRCPPKEPTARPG